MNSETLKEHQRILNAERQQHHREQKGKLKMKIQFHQKEQKKLLMKLVNYHKFKGTCLSMDFTWITSSYIR